MCLFQFLTVTAQHFMSGTEVIPIDFTTGRFAIKRNRSQCVPKGCRTSHQMIICTCHFYQMLTGVSFILRASRYIRYFARHKWHPYYVDKQVVHARIFHIPNIFTLNILVSKSSWFLNTTIMTNVNFSTIGINAPLPKTATFEQPLCNQTVLNFSF